MSGANGALNADLYNRQLHSSESEKLAVLKRGRSAEDQQRLIDAACALVHCSAGVPDYDPNRQALVDSESWGSRYTSEQDEIRAAGAFEGYSGLDSFGDAMDRYQVSNRTVGAVHGVTGAAGAAAALGAGCSTIVVCGFAATVATTSLDYSKAGFQQLIHGEQTPTYGEQMLRGLGMSPNGAAMAYGAANLGSTLGRTAIGLPRVNQAVRAPAIQDADTSTSTSAGNLTITAGKFSPHERSMARHLASQGYRVVLRSPVGRRTEGKTSDLLVNGVPYDVYTPQTASVHRIVGAIADKNSQAQGIVLDLSETSVTREQLGNLLQRVRGTGATNIQDIKIIGKQDAEHQMRMRP